MQGIQTFSSLIVPITVTNSDVLVNVFRIPIAANKRQKVKFWLPINVGAAGGVRAQITVPAAGVSFKQTLRLNNTVAPSATIAAVAASTLFTNALANAGDHWIEAEVDVRNGINAGFITLQMAQNTADADPLVVSEASMEVFKY